jgi:hypothetical protein
MSSSGDSKETSPCTGSLNIILIGGPAQARGPGTDGDRERGQGTGTGDGDGNGDGDRDVYGAEGSGSPVRGGSGIFVRENVCAGGGVRRAARPCQ